MQDNLASLYFSALALPTFFPEALVPFSGEWYLETRLEYRCFLLEWLLLGSLLTDRRCMCVFIDQPTCTCLPLMISVTVLSSVNLSMASPTPQEHASLLPLHICNPVLWQGHTQIISYPFTPTWHMWKWLQSCSPAPLWQTVYNTVEYICQFASGLAFLTAG